MMDTIYYTEKAHFLTTEEDIKIICNPLFKESRINHFCFFRAFDDGSFIVLISNGKLCSHHFDSGYKVFPSVPDKIIQDKFYYITLPSMYDHFEQVIYDYKNFFGMHYPIFLAERYESYFDTFIYGSGEDSPSIINYYLNNMDTLEQFKFYFKDKANKIIKESYKNKLIITECTRPNFGGINNKDIFIDKPVINERLIPTHYYLGGKYDKISLTKREGEVAKQLAMGLTMKEIAQIMTIDPRTVESHIHRLKTKFDAKRKSEVIRIILKTGLFSAA